MTPAHIPTISHLSQAAGHEGVAGGGKQQSVIREGQRPAPFLKVPDSGEKGHLAVVAVQIQRLVLRSLLLYLLNQMEVCGPLAP